MRIYFCVSSLTGFSEECKQNTYYSLRLTKVNKYLIFFQECVPERLEMKQAVYDEIDLFLRDDVILASSASALLPSILAEKIKHKNRYIVAHPVITFTKQKSLFI